MKSNFNYKNLTHSGDERENWLLSSYDDGIFIYGRSRRFSILAKLGDEVDDDMVARHNLVKEGSSMQHSVDENSENDSWETVNGKPLESPLNDVPKSSNAVPDTYVEIIKKNNLIKQTRGIATQREAKDVEVSCGGLNDQKAEKIGQRNDHGPLNAMAKVIPDTKPSDYDMNDASRVLAWPLLGRFQ
ncbi:hypothetical protein SLA2020_461310 [Shorea laevis]